FLYGEFITLDSLYEEKLVNSSIYKKNNRGFNFIIPSPKVFFVKAKLLMKSKIKRTKIYPIILQVKNMIKS
ncbi:hypothetical protein L4D13_27750, partial [Photobacterium profundum]|uniref:hypothetical protein n=1 Tax=Photobacterium profundum TaxID=74109 RepID=UPI003D0F0267